LTRIAWTRFEWQPSKNAYRVSRAVALHGAEPLTFQESPLDQSGVIELPQGDTVGVRGDLFATQVPVLLATAEVVGAGPDPREVVRLGLRPTGGGLRGLGVRSWARTSFELGGRSVLEVIDVTVRLEGATRRVRFLELGAATYDTPLLPDGQLLPGAFLGPRQATGESTTLQSVPGSDCTTLFNMLTTPIECPRTNIAGETRVVGECINVVPDVRCVQSVIGERLMSDIPTVPVTITCSYLDGVPVDAAQLPSLAESGVFDATSTWCEVVYQTSYRLTDVVTIGVVFGSFEAGRATARDGNELDGPEVPEVLPAR
jgi:hypothetical protein